MQKNTFLFYRAFSIIEVMIGIFVFSLWLVAIFAILTSSLGINDLNKNSIIAGELAREQIELVRNIRDTNYKNLKLWNQQDPSVSLTLWDRTDPSKVFLSDNYYFIENNFTSWSIESEHLGSSILEWEGDLSSMQSAYGLCFDTLNRYVKCSSTSPITTNFFKYLKFEPARDDAWNLIDDAYILISKVIWYKRGYHEFELRTIITDWRRI